MNIQKNDDEHLDARAADRGDVAVVVDVRVSGCVKTKARLLDLSQTGFRMNCMTIFVTDQLFFLTIPPLPLVVIAGVGSAFTHSETLRNSFLGTKIRFHGFNNLPKQFGNPQGDFRWVNL